MDGKYGLGKYSSKVYRVGGLGDGACDGVLNVPAYQYDLGDCCKPLNGTKNGEPHNAICNYEDDCICHMFTDFHGRNFKKFLCFFKYVDTFCLHLIFRIL